MWYTRKTEQKNIISAMKCTINWKIPFLSSFIFDHILSYYLHLLICSTKQFFISHKKIICYRWILPLLRLKRYIFKFHCLCRKTWPATTSASSTLTEPRKMTKPSKVFKYICDNEEKWINYEKLSREKENQTLHSSKILIKIQITYHF